MATFCGVWAEVFERSCRSSEPGAGCVSEAEGDSASGLFVVIEDGCCADVEALDALLAVRRRRWARKSSFSFWVIFFHLS